jgi:hypothetical protein
VLTGSWLAACLVAFSRLQNRQVGCSLAVSAAVAAWGFFATKKLIPIVARYTERRGLYGYDINKKGTAAGDKKVRAPLCCSATVAVKQVDRATQVAHLLAYGHTHLRTHTHVLKKKHIHTQSHTHKQTHTITHTHRQSK